MVSADRTLLSDVLTIVCFCLFGITVVILVVATGRENIALLTGKEEKKKLESMRALDVWFADIENL